MSNLRFDGVSKRFYLVLASLYSSHSKRKLGTQKEKGKSILLFFLPLFWTIQYDRYIPMQTLIITLLRSVIFPRFWLVNLQGQDTWTLWDEQAWRNLIRLYFYIFVTNL